MAIQDLISLKDSIGYIYSVLILLVAVMVAKLVTWFINNYAKKIASKTKTKLDDLIFERIGVPIYYFFIIFGVFLALSPLNLSENIELILRRIILSINILFGAFIIVQVLGIFLSEWIKKKVERTKSELDDALFPIFSRIVNVIIYTLAALYILRVWQIEITPLLAGLGVAGLAIGLALQETLSNMFSGISVVADRYFKVGDIIQLDSGETGEVLDISLRSTKIRTFNNEIMIIPNSKIANNKIINYAQPDKKARISLDISVAYGSNVERIKKVVLDTVKELAKKEKHIILDEKPPAIFFVEMGDFALKFSLKVWVNNYRKRYGIKDKLNTEIYNALRKAKIEIPFPTRTVYIKKERKR